MKSEEIRSLFVRFEAAAEEFEGVECLSALELQHLLGYSEWKNFEKAVEKAKVPAEIPVKKQTIIFLTSGKR